jgi:beta-glucosidase
MADASILKMPPGFLWGAATAAHQNEGDNHNNQWSVWEEQPNRIYAGQRCGQATNWWDLETAAADFDRAAELGMNSLRMSVEWSRIEPRPGVFDEAALRKYREMVSLLRTRGLKPLITLHHFTDPLWLTEMGAWEHPQATDFFARFVRRVVEVLGDLVTFWCTINEPLVYAYSGYLIGVFPPGVKSLPRALKVLRQLLLAHGRAYRLIHSLQNNAEVGLAHNMQVLLPANPHSRIDRGAASMLNRLVNHAMFEAITSGRMLPVLGLGEHVGPLTDSSDYIGLNYYSTARVAFDLSQPSMLFARLFYDPQMELSDRSQTGQPYGEINPHGLYLALKQLAGYHKPIYITENGVPDSDDDVRPRFIATHLAEAWRAVQEGADLRGFYHWTLVDNFEWCEAYGLKFGLFGIDPDTGERVPKTSAAVYGRIAQANGVPHSLLARLAPLAAASYFPTGR